MSRFLKDTDYSVQILSDTKDIIASSPTKLLWAEEQAIAQLSEYIGGRVDVSRLLSVSVDAEGNDTRNRFIVMLLIDVTLYHLYSAYAYTQMPQHRSARYEDALAWLKQVGLGEIKTQLPARIDETTGVQQEPDFFLNAYPKMNNRF